MHKQRNSFGSSWPQEHLESDARRNRLLPLILGVWVDGLRGDSSKNVFSLPHSGCDPVCSFGAGRSLSCFGGSVCTASAPAAQKRGRGWVSNFWQGPLRPVHQVTQMVLPPPGPHCQINVPKIAQCDRAIPLLKNHPAFSAAHRTVLGFALTLQIPTIWPPLALPTTSLSFSTQGHPPFAGCARTLAETTSRPWFGALSPASQPVYTTALLLLA